MSARFSQFPREIPPGGDQLGYEITYGEDGKERVLPVNPEAQRRFEATMWTLRQDAPLVDGDKNPDGS